MEFTGRFVNVMKDWSTDEWHITFTVNEKTALNYIDTIKDAEKLSIDAHKYSKRRSLDANALMWVMISQLAAVQKVDKWKVYLECLDSYGKCCPVTINANAVETFKMNWREVKEVGRYMQDGIEKVSLLCYYGSSLLTAEEFSNLLEGIKHEMEANGLQPPESEEMRRSLAQWEKVHTVPTESSNQL